MKQYQDLLQAILDKGTYKPAARENMPGTQSLFGYQFRHDLSNGFPLLTTKKMFWKGIVTELIWFLRGDTNIKYLIDNGVHIWNEDAYNYYLKQIKKLGLEDPLYFDSFIENIKEGYLDPGTKILKDTDYRYGDCGYQYGDTWRRFGKDYEMNFDGHDQISAIIKQLKNQPESRRHLVTAIDPHHDTDLALYWCHAMFQFNCRPIQDKVSFLISKGVPSSEITNDLLDSAPSYCLDCQLYQRSADAVLGVPFNIASYALLTHLIAEMCNMIPGEFIHTFGDVHIYDNHRDAVKEQLSRTPTALPEIRVLERHIDHGSLPDHFGKYITGRYTLDNFLNSLTRYDFRLIGYNPQESIKAELSTGLKK